MRTAQHMNPDQDLVVSQDGALSTCGCVSYWRAGGTISVAELTKAWIASGLDAKLLRKEVDPATALRRAVLSLASRTQVNDTTEVRTLIRPGKERHVWAVVQETVVKGVSKPLYVTQAVVKQDQLAGFVVDQVDGPSSIVQALKIDVGSRFRAQQGLFDPSDITGWLVKLAYAHDAVTLRESGGVYFIPRPAMGFWNSAADVVEHVSKGNHRVFRIPAMRTAEAVAAITDAVAAEANDFVNEVEKELDATGDDELGKRALATRETQAKALLEKVASYEKLLGLQISIVARVRELSATVAAAALA